MTKEFRLRTPDQDVLWLSGITTLSERPGSSDIISFLAVSSIREKRLTELTVRKMVEEQCDYICCIDERSGRIILFIDNRRRGARKKVRVGTAFEDVINQTFVNYVEQEYREAYLKFTNFPSVISELKEKDAVSAIFSGKENGETRIKQLTFSYLDKDNGLIALIKTDITEAHRQQLEQEENLRIALDLADKASAAKYDFLSSMSHDLRTPLNAVLGFTDFALKEDDLQKKNEYLNKIHSSGNLLLELINDTLDLSRIESGKITPDPEAVMTDDLIPSVVSSLMPSAELKGVNLIGKYGNYRNEPVWADKLKIKKIALNLLSNSIKFTHAGGKVTVSLKSTAKDHENEDYCFIIEGTGLGLSIVRRYVDLLGGTIEVESHIHKGTRWTVTIPVKRFQDGLLQKPDEQTAINLHGRRILLCEDNIMNMEIAVTLLKDQGMMVECAENGADGLKMFAQSQEGYYDAVLMDIQMPVMNGYDASVRIRSLDRGDARTVPIIAMTADAFEEGIRKAKELGMSAYITKPIEPQKMFEIIQKALYRAE